MNEVREQIQLREVLVQYGVTVVVIALAASVLYNLVDVTTLRRVAGGIRLAPYLLAVCLFYVTFPMRTVRWQRLLANVDVTAGGRSATTLILLNWFLNTVLPAKAGDLHRAYVSGREYDTSSATVLGTIAAERAFDLSVLAVGIALTMLLVVGTFSDVERRIVWLALGLLVVIGAGVAGVVFLRPSLLPEIVQPLVEDFQRGITAVHSLQDGAVVVALTVAIWGTNVFRMSLVAVAIGVHIDVPLLILTALLVAFLSGLPYTPAGLGVVELVTTTVLIQAGVSRNLGFSFVLFDRLITVGSLVLVGSVGYLYLKFGGRGYRRPSGEQ